MAMSGGIDSSVSAALLKKQGFNVIGAFIFFEKNKSSNQNPKSCCSLEGYESAKRIAEKINIPLYTINFDIDFKKDVIENFIQEYQSGRTPNPCVRCNKYLKFGRLLEKAKELNCQFVATGHYACIKKKKNN